MTRAIVGDLRRELWRHGGRGVVVPHPQKRSPGTKGGGYDNMMRARSSQSIKDHQDYLATPGQMSELMDRDVMAANERLLNQIPDHFGRAKDAALLRLSGMTMKNVGLCLGVCESRVSQLLSSVRPVVAELMREQEAA